MSVSGIEAMTIYLRNSKNHGKLHDRDGNSLLFKTVRWGHVGLTQQLLELGEDIESVHKSRGCTPLGSCIYNRGGDWLKVASMLVQRGANINVPDERGFVLIDLILNSGDYDLIKAVYSRDEMDINAISPVFENQTPLDYAISRGSDKIAQLLIDLGADFKQALLTTKLYVSTVQMLLDAGADLNAKAKDGKTPLHYAVSVTYRYNLEVALLLLKAGADVEARDNRGRTSLMCAARMGNEALVNLLLDYGANINAADEAGNTALHRSFISNNPAMMQLLLDAGADAYQVNHAGIAANPGAMSDALNFKENHSSAFDFEYSLFNWR